MVIHPAFHFSARRFQPRTNNLHWRLFGRTCFSMLAGVQPGRFHDFTAGDKIFQLDYDTSIALSRYPRRRPSKPRFYRYCQLTSLAGISADFETYSGFGFGDSGFSFQTSHINVVHFLANSQI
jgi:hypothetical protein